MIVKKAFNRKHEILVQAGWTLIGHKKSGVLRLKMWSDPTDGEVMSQVDAVRIQNERNKETRNAKKIPH